MVKSNLTIEVERLKKV